MSDLEAQLGRARLFVVGTIYDLAAAESERVARLGDPGRPFFVSGRNLPSSGPYPDDLFYAGSDSLASHGDAVAYLGLEGDRNLMNTIELTGAEQTKIARRGALAAGAVSLAPVTGSAAA